MLLGVLTHHVLASASASAQASSWWDHVRDKAIQMALVILGAILLWFLGRTVIRGLTRSISTGLPLSRRARRALAKALEQQLETDPQSARLAAQRRAQRAGTIRAVLTSTLATAIVATVAVTLLDIVGLPVAPLLASAGIVGVALGFGAQSLVKDVLAGLFMLIEDQYGVGDVVDLGAATGTVEEVGLRVTRLRSLDGTVWFVPNGEVTRVGNLSKVFSRAVIELRLDYSTDVDAARATLLDAVAAARQADKAVNAAILGEPEVPGIEAFDYDAVLLRLIVPVAPTTQWTVARAVRSQLRPLLAQRGIRMAVPDHTLYLDATHPAKRTAPGGEDTTSADAAQRAAAKGRGASAGASAGASSGTTPRAQSRTQGRTKT